MVGLLLMVGAELIVGEDVCLLPLPALPPLPPFPIVVLIVGTAVVLPLGIPGVLPPTTGGDVTFFVTLGVTLGVILGVALGVMVM